MAKNDFKDQVAWDGSFPSCDSYMRVQIKDPTNSQYYNWWTSNGGSLQQHQMTQAFVRNSSNFLQDDELTNEEMLAKSHIIYHGTKPDLAKAFLDSPYNDPQEFFAKVNELRTGAELPLAIPDYALMRKMEFEQIKKDSRQYQPSLRKLIEMGIPLDDIKYSRDCDEVIQKLLLRNPSLKLEETQEEFAQTYFEALDYIDRHDKMMLIKLETASPAQLKRLATKREKDYQLLNSCGFSDEEIAEHKTLIQKMENDPSTIKKAYRLLQATGKANPDDKLDTNDSNKMDDAKKLIKDNIRNIKYLTKGAFWCVACSGWLTLHTVSLLTGEKPKKNIFSRYVRKDPRKLAKAYKKEKKKEKALGMKVVREQKYRQNEYMRQRLAKDYHTISTQKVFTIKAS